MGKKILYLIRCFHLFIYFLMRDKIYICQFSCSKNGKKFHKNGNGINYNHFQLISKEQKKNNS